jgi:N-acetylneuraminic acid mutarotase
MKKLIMLSLFTYTLSFIPAAAQGVWSSRDTLPYDTNAMFQGIPGFSIGNYGYAGIGQNSVGITDEFWQFDPSNNSWTRKAPFPGRARIAPACFVIGNKAYIVTGSIANAFPCVTECWEYDATIDTWTQKADFPGSARVYAAGFAIDSLGYVGTGANELADFRKDFYAYHPSTNTWTRIADIGGIARDCDNGFGVNGNGYVCFGQDSTLKRLGDMWEYDPVANTWTQKNSLPGPATFGASGFSICSNIYVGNGDDTLEGCDSIFWKYSTVSDSWAQVAGVPGIRKIAGAAFAIGDSGYYGFGGFCVNTGDLNLFYRFFDNDSCIVTTGIRNDSKLLNISIYPNPFDRECSITLPDAYATLPAFTLYSMDGIRQKVDICGNNLNYTLKRNSLSNGVYILSINYNGSTFYKKLIITN